MIETLIINRLEAAGLRAFAEDPADPTQKPYYVIQKTAGSAPQYLRRATVAVQSYGETMLGAAQANAVMIPVVLGMAEHSAVSRVELNSDYNFTDTEKKRPRYQAVFDFTYYEEETA